MTRTIPTRDDHLRMAEMLFSLRRRTIAIANEVRMAFKSRRAVRHLPTDDFRFKMEREINRVRCTLDTEWFREGHDKGWTGKKFPYYPGDLDRPDTPPWHLSGGGLSRERHAAIAETMRQMEDDFVVVINLLLKHYPMKVGDRLLRKSQWLILVFRDYLHSEWVPIYWADVNGSPHHGRRSWEEEEEEVRS